MAITELTLSSDQAANLVLVLRAVERLPLLTEDIIQATDEGESYETLCRQIRAVHTNLSEISTMAAAASFSNAATVAVSQAIQTAAVCNRQRALPKRLPERWQLGDRDNA